MKKFRQSIYDKEHLFLRTWLVEKRKERGLTQRQLAEKLDVVHSLVGKIEKGERRLDFVEFLSYSKQLDLGEDDLSDLIRNLYKLLHRSS